MALWDACLAFVMVVAGVNLAAGSGLFSSRVVLAVAWASMAVLLMWWGARAPGWLLHLLVDVNTLLLVGVAMTAPSSLRAVAMLLLLTLAALYSATWFPRGQMAGHLLVLVVASGVLALANVGQDEFAAVWVVFLMVTFGTAYFVNSLVAHLNWRAVVDPLTGLLNRRGLEVALMAQGRGSPADPCVVAVIDLDGFKVVNDERGHEAGDNVLRDVAAVLRKHVRPSDVVARMGGDEFLVVFRRTDPSFAESVMERLLGQLPIACSYGLARWDGGTPLHQVMARADGAMYAAKAARARR